MTIQAALKSQYHAAMAMLKAALDSCPEELWADDSYRNQSWQVLYHTLFYTDFYLSASEMAFSQINSDLQSRHAPCGMSVDMSRISP